MDKHSDHMGYSTPLLMFIDISSRRVICSSEKTLGGTATTENLDDSDFDW